jgi:hypothetical protein
VSIVGPFEARPADGLAVDFVVESDRAQLGEIVQRVRDGRLRTNIGTVATLDDAVAAFNPTARRPGKTIIRVRPEDSGMASGSALSSIIVFCMAQPWGIDWVAAVSGWQPSASSPSMPNEFLPGFE